MEQHDRRPASFNGAATFRLRKAPTEMELYVEDVASMGPQPFGCGRTVSSSDRQT